jgi:HEAT repeat protein
MLLLTTLLGAAEPTFHGKTFAEWKVQLEKGTSQERKRAAMALGLGPFGKQAVPHLEKALQDENEHVRRWAIEALGELGSDAEAAVASLAVQLRIPENLHHAAICTALGKIGPAAIPVLMAALNTKNESEQRSIAEGLRLIGKPALPALEKELLTGKHPKLAAETMARLGVDAAAALPSLLRALATKDNELRKIILETIAGLGARAEPAMPALVKLLDHDDESDRIRAARALVSIGKPAWPTLRQVMDKGSAAARLGVMTSLRPEWDEALPRLLKFLKNGPEDARWEAAYQLREFGLDLPDRLPILRVLLRDPDWDVRNSLYGIFNLTMPVCDEAYQIAALSVLDPDPEAKRAVAASRYWIEELPESVAAVYITALRDRRTDVRRWAVFDLARLNFNSPALELALCEALQDKDEKVRAGAARALVSLGPRVQRVTLANDRISLPRVIQALQARLRDGDERVRGWAAVALCRVGYPTDAVVRQTARLLIEQPREDRLVNAACDALEKCRDRAKAAVPILVRGLEDSNVWVRQNVAEALASLGPTASAAVPALTLAVKDEDFKTKERAILALAAIGPRGIAALIRILEGPDREEKAAVCMSFREKTTNCEWLIPFVEQLLADEELCELASEFLVCQEAYSEGLRKVLTERLSIEIWGPRLYACQELRAMGPKAAASLAAIKLLLLDFDDTVRAEAARTLAAIDPNGKTVVPSLIDTLTDKDNRVRATAATALGTIGPGANAALPAIRNALKDSSDAVRVEAAFAVWRISGEKEEATRALKCVCRDGKGEPRVRAIDSMRKIEKRQEQLEMLVRLIEDQDEEAITLAAEKLLALGEETRIVLPAIAKLTKHPSVAVRRHAFTILYALRTRQKEPQ